jgi:hypothetical protein
MLPPDEKLGTEGQIAANEDARTRSEPQRVTAIRAVANADRKTDALCERSLQVEHAEESSIASCDGKFLGRDPIPGTEKGLLHCVED